MPHKGYKQTAEVIAAKSARQLGRKQSPEWIAKRTASRIATIKIRGFPCNTGRNISTENRAAASERMKAMWLNPEWRAKAVASVRAKRGPMPESIKIKISASLKGRKHSPEAIEKTAAAHRGKHLSADVRARISAARIGTKASLETRARISASQIGRKHKPADLKKMSLSQIGKKLSNETKAKISAAHTGRKHTIETRAKVSAALRLRCGPKSSNWKGGITKKNVALRNAEAVQIWRKAVFCRDGYTCRNCGVHGGYLNAHHILEFMAWPQFRTDLWNGRTLCRSCHKKVDDDARAEKNRLVVPVPAGG